MYSRKEIIEELKCFYSSLEFEKKYGKTYENSSDEEINKIFQLHCDEYKQEIQIGDLFEDSFNHEFLINSPDGFVETGDLYIKGPYPIYTIKTSEFSIKCSKGHLIETIKGWKDVAELKESDSILTKKGYQDISYIREGSSEDVYDLEVLHKNHRYWGGTGISSHNTGKSFLAVSSCREAQKQGWTPIYLDSENSMSPEFVGRLGCDPKNFIIKQVSTVKEVTTFIINLCKSFEEQGVTFPKVFLVLDSLGNLTSDKELGDSIEGKTARDMTRAQEVKALFRVVTTPLARLQIPLICINHVYASMSFMGGFSQASGCLFPEEEIITKSGNKAIKDVVIGDEVLSHDGNYHLVEKTWTHQKNSYQIDFEGNKKIQCSDTHRFLINPSEPEKDESWVLASELKDGDEIYIIEE